MSTPRVSVAMVTRNVERFLPEAIESILNQTFTDLEFVIVDFGSTDASKSIILSYQQSDPRIKFHEIPTCSLADARNASCFLSVGRYIAIMDADDIAVQDRLERQLAFLERHPEVGALGGATELIDHAGQVSRTLSYPCGNSEIQKGLLTTCPLCNPTVVIRRDIFAAVGGFRNLAPAEDYDLWLRVSEHCELANLSNIVLRYRIHPHQESQRNIRQQMLGQLVARATADLRRSGKPDPLNSVREINLELLLTLGVSEERWQRALVTRYRQVIETTLLAGDYSAGLKLVAEILDSSDWKHVETWQIAEIWLESAWLYWGKREFLRSGASIGRAILVRPLVMARPLKLLFRQMRGFFTPQPEAR